MKSTEQLKNEDFKREIIMIAAMETPASIIFFVAIYAKFAGNGNAFHPLLNNMSLVNLMLVVSGYFMAWSGYRVFKLLKVRSMTDGNAGSQKNQ